MENNKDLIAAASWFLSYATRGQPSWVARKLLAERFQLDEDAALAVFKAVKQAGGADDDAS
ncbi:hypothetical protein NKJ59_02695 [Mesorhizobium australicum]|uniref:hypothetical protein n=1 Tax=Mesorhizobium australicum TaxID=536018 RepID=UPI00333D5B19